MTIASDPQQTAELEEILDPVVAKLVDDYSAKGFGTLEVLDAIQEIVINCREEYNTKPVGASVEEPSNDWPGAEAEQDIGEPGA